MDIVSELPRNFRVYHEPFVGSGGVLSILQPHRAEAADSLEPLIELWQTVQKEPETAKRWYRDRWHDLLDGDKREQYNRIRARYNASPNPADLLILCRSAYGGIMRFRMRDGHMTTACGSHSPIHYESFNRRVDEWARRISGTTFFHREYAESLDRAGEGDLVYCDPPYSHSQSILYGAQSFCQDDLFRCIERAKARGAFVALSLDGTKKSGRQTCDYSLPRGLFARQVDIGCGGSMLRRLQMGGQQLEGEGVTDRLLLTH